MFAKYTLLSQTDLGSSTITSAIATLVPGGEGAVVEDSEDKERFRVGSK
eukprot:gene53266-71214_t